MIKKIIAGIFLLMISINVPIWAQSVVTKWGSSQPINQLLGKIPGNVNWDVVEPVSTSPASDALVGFKITDIILSTPGRRRDPSDVINYNGKYYVWYTKSIGRGPYPEGWGATVWYATSTDGKEWVEEGLAVGCTEDSWDEACVYSPNILAYKGKFYIAYTAVRYPYTGPYSQASIGIAVADSPDGPWVKLSNNPVISPGESLQSLDGFLADDAVFVVLNDRIWLYYKGYPRWENSEGRNIRCPRHTYLLVTCADTPEGPYTKHPLPLHRGHEAVVWKDETGIGSLGINWGERIYYHSDNGLNFQAMNPLDFNKENNRIMAAGIYREDFDKTEHFQKPEWGICMFPGGLARFEIIWP